MSREQYDSWSLSRTTGDSSEDILNSLSGGFCVGGSRENMIEYLAHIEYTETFADRIRQAHDDGLLTADELEHVLTMSLRNPPLPPLIERSSDVPALPFDRVQVDREPYMPTPHEEPTTDA